MPDPTPPCTCGKSHHATTGHAPQAPHPDVTCPKTAHAAYHIPNMDCPMEEALIRKKLAGMPGVVGMHFNLMRRTLTVTHTLADTRPIEDALRAIDMTPEAPAAPATPAPSLGNARIPWGRLALAGGAAALSEAVELLHAANPAILRPVLAYAPLALALVAIALSGLGTYRKGWLAIRNRELNINALMSVAVTGAVCIGQFPEAAMVMVLFNISEAMEARALNRARNAIKGLLELAPDEATVRQPDGGFTRQNVRDVATGARVRVGPGERIPLDGVVCAGHSAINQGPITGESLPVEKGPGDLVYAGSINTAGELEFTVTAAAHDTTLARIIHAVEEAQNSRAPIQRLVDTFARHYTPAVFALALLTAIVPPLALGWNWLDAVYTGLVLLVIGCPCALVISTPVSLVSGMAAATRAGILVKGGAYLELGRKLSCLALDKTGTLTHGTPVQTDRERLPWADAGTAPHPPHSPDDAELVALAASLAGHSDHPVSRAISEAARGLPLRDVREFTALPGRGVRGVVDGVMWHLGNPALARALGHDTPDVRERCAALERTGKSVSLLLGEDGPYMLFAVADTLRDTSVQAVRQLRELGVRTVMLTGDNAHTAAAIGRQAGVDAIEADLLPADKLRCVERLEQEGGVIGMAGDGVNDAPALARAHVGFAMAGGGSDTAIETADVALMDDDLRKIPRFIRISRTTCAILRQNILLALGIKVVFFALAFAGLASMWMAVFADVGAALLVTGNGLRALRA